MEACELNGLAAGLIVCGMLAAFVAVTWMGFEYLKWLQRGETE